MKQTKTILASTLLMLLMSALLSTPVQAAQADWSETAMEATGFSNAQRLSDGSRSTYTAASEEAVVTLSRSGGIAAIYIEFDRIPQPWTLTQPASGQSAPCGGDGFLHEFVDVSVLLQGQPETVELHFPAGTAVAELYAFSQGALPSWVQVWQPPLEEADLLLLSSHSDDEQLFFAGVLPYYAIERELEVQVAYLVQHFEARGTQDHIRPHEQLDGLWAMGVRAYPIISDFPDYYSTGNTRDKALANALSVYETTGDSYEDFVSYITSCIRRCKPLVVVSHDLDGEYGHGTHVLCADALTTALDRAADPEQNPDSAAYGPWQVEKTYLHLYEENPIVMDWDTPLDSLGGKTPFQMTQEGFALHKSQHWTWFYKWIYGTAAAPITRADQVRSYSPCRYGLYASQVGPDAEGGDFFEHVETYAQRRDRAAREEAQRLAEEEALAQAQRAQEEAARQAEEEARMEEALRQAEQARMQARHLAGMVVAAVAALGLCALAALLLIRGKRR